MKHLMYIAVQIYSYSIIGIGFMSGMKAIDWLIPSPPQEPIKIELNQKEKSDVQPTTQGKHSFLIG